LINYNYNNRYETLKDAVKRECTEETGYAVNVIRFAALYEAIYTDEIFRKENPEHTHKIYHVFICELTDGKQAEPTEKDAMQTGSEWADIKSINMPENLDTPKLYPLMIGDNIQQIINGTAPVFLGTEQIDD